MSVVVFTPTALIPGSNGLFALIDAADLDLVAPYTWTVSKSKKWYAKGRAPKQRTVQLHRLIMGEAPGPGLVVDHINGLTVDCRRANLRWATPRQNAQNSAMKKSNKSGFKGVTKYKDNLFQARIHVNGESISLGYYRTAEDASNAYTKAAHDYFGEFANVPH